MHRATTIHTWDWLTHLVWVMGNAVHVGMCTMVRNGQLIIIFYVIISQIIIWIHAAFLLQPLTLHRHAHKRHDTMFWVEHNAACWAQLLHKHIHNILATAFACWAQLSDMAPRLY